MRITKPYIWITVLILFQSMGYACTPNSMGRELLRIPLKEGKNPPVQFEALVLEPVNLFIQSKPWNDRSPHIQLELNISGVSKEYSTFLWYYEDNADLGTNYPKAFEKYLLSLDTDKDEVELVISELDFGQAFFIDIHQKIVIGDLVLKFEESMGEWWVNPDGTYAGASTTYTLLLSNYFERNILHFTSSTENESNEQSLKWRNYTIELLGDWEDRIKLKVSK